MVTRILFWVVLACVVIGLVYHVVQRLLTTDEDRVRAAIRGMASGLERENVLLSIAGVAQYLSKDYLHHGEKMGGEAVLGDKMTALAYIRVLKQRYREFKVEFKDVHVRIQVDPTSSAKTARVELMGRITALPRKVSATRQEILSRPGRNRALLDFKKEGGYWMLFASRRVEGKWQE